MLSSIREMIEKNKKVACYDDYLEIRDKILNMLDDASDDGDSIPSEYWQEEIAGFDYMFDASPLIVNKLREHCYHITGLKSYEYREHHSHKAGAFAKKLEMLKKIDNKGLFVPESPMLGGYGHKVNGDLVNIDTLKFYETVIAMDKSGLLDLLGEDGAGKTLVEIGGGWGGFGYTIKKLFPKLTYVIIDLPPTLLFSATYLSAVFPESKNFIYKDKELDTEVDFSEYDFVFLPHYFIDKHKIKNIDIAINMISFQEMTSEQVLGYVKWFAECDCKNLYSHNRGKSPHNTQMSCVDDLLEKYYDCKKISMLDIPYTVLTQASTNRFPLNKVGAKDFAKNIIKKIALPDTGIQVGVHDYKHLVGVKREG